MTASMTLNCVPYSSGYGNYNRPVTSNYNCPISPYSNNWQQYPPSSYSQNNNLQQQFYNHYNQNNTSYSTNCLYYSPAAPENRVVTTTGDSYHTISSSPVSTSSSSVTTTRTSPPNQNTFHSYYEYYGPCQSSNSQQRSSPGSQENVVFPEPDTVELPEVHSLSGGGDTSTSSSLSSLSSNEEEDKLPIATLIKSGKLNKIAKKKRKSKKDPNEPEKPVPAYALFFRDTQPQIKSQKPDATFGEISKIVAALWDNLDADKKADYKKTAESAKKEYLKKLAAYKAQLLSTEVPEPVVKKEMAPEKIEEEPRRTFTHPPNRCIREGCNNISIDDPRWDRQFCSTECVVRHCREAFQGWVAIQQEKDGEGDSPLGNSGNHLLSMS